MGRPRKPLLTTDEIARPFNEPKVAERWPPVLGVPGVASLLRITRKSVYFWLAQGRFDGAARKRGKHWFFFRDKVIEVIFNAPEWSNDHE